MARYKDTRALKEIGKRLKAKRLKENLNIEDVIEMTGFTYKKISDMENGHETSLSYFIQVCLAIRIHPCDLLKFDIGDQPRFKLSPTRREKSRLTPRIMEYMDKGYFNQPRTARDVVEKLADDFGLKTDSSTVSSILRRIALEEQQLLRITKSGRNNQYQTKSL
ncbi:hypothetical protein [Sinomicrobium soli]|uniref:hypothetical protein n=1 Tax=Sinomicrobium sp. N-1-3-6 TaxID=2219864 RepID=UPI000DCB3B82|nr:hypothetical protein [Sinomicrobium sp. N-1-3-6]RAV29188.1 hypothetical protein DN748_09725 [Sinomicrobium sp. N-1-3-6]